MKKIITISSVMLILFACGDISTTDITLESFTYSENFETNELSAWASYPLWQDTAFDPNMRVGRIVPGDSNLSIVQKVTPYTNVDNYAGAQKKLDMCLVSGSNIKLRYYLKTQLDPEFFKIRLAAGPNGKVDYTISNPETNKWVWIEATYNDFVKQNPELTTGKIKVNALSVLAKFPKADPAMPIYLGVDDVELKGVRKVPFSFSEPEMANLSEWKPYIAKKHYKSGETFSLKGTWPVDADSVSLKITSFTERENTILSKDLNRNDNEWNTEFELTFPEGLYLASLEAYKDSEKLSDTQFTIFIKPGNIGGNHPRLWFDEEGQNRVVSRLRSTRFQNVKDEIISEAKAIREGNPIESIVFDIDQIPGGDIDPNWGFNIRPWFARIVSWREGVYYNALAYSLLGDKQAGEYGKNLLVKISTFPYWVHPWWKDRGRHIYYPIGELGMGLALGYDLLYDLMDEKEREKVRSALIEQVVNGCHAGYVEDDLVTNNTSNWVAHVTGGSMMCQAAMYGDDDNVQVEPYFTGVIFKAYDLIQKAFGSDDTYGEGYGYYRFTMLSLSKCLPAMDNIFKIDMSGKINGSYKEQIWAGNINNKKYCHFGDSGGDLVPLTNWAWLLEKYKDPLLGWFYSFLKKDETMMDVLYETENVSRDDPFKNNPVKVFRDVGTTVFKSGWGKDDFIFVMRTGAFYNHQHLDQGSFWLLDRGSDFIVERHGYAYYDCPYYQSWFTQPVAHSTILIDHNHQSQRVGDPLEFADGYNDYAFIYNFLDGSDMAFSSGDIGRLYWGKVKEMRRNVLYLKPRTLLMLDVIVPSEKDVDVTLLYQTDYLKDIHADQTRSTITKENNILHIKHIFPEKLEIKAVETPHYINTIRRVQPLVKEGMLTVTANTGGKPLVMANVLVTTEGEEPDISYQNNKGYVSGVADGRSFIFSTSPGDLYNNDNFITDALTLTWDSEKTFAAIVKSLKRDGKLLIASDIPITCEISGKSIKYYHTEEAYVTIGVENEPASVLLNGREVTDWKYNQKEGNFRIKLPEGEGILIINQ
ncbi:MAG: heparinase II/III family protein [Bacteroidales bacterium]|nr:heparinase II/III family protein [Bacteroidales bacterium]